MLHADRRAGPARGQRTVLTQPPLPGGQASESLLARARCYGFLGQRKTAMFDLDSLLRAEPGNVQALCGRALLHLALDRRQVLAPPSPPGLVEGVLCGRCRLPSRSPRREGAGVRPS